MENLVQWFTTALQGIPKELIILIISMIPILELRGGLIAATLLGVNIKIAVPICIIGNIIPVPFILLFITKIFNALKKTKFFRPFVEKMEKKALGKSEKFERGIFWGLVLFVGIPLPGTGAWTGSLIAALLDVKFKKAFPAVMIGIILATIIMSIVSYGLLASFI